MKHIKIQVPEFWMSSSLCRMKDAQKTIGIVKDRNNKIKDECFGNRLSEAEIQLGVLSGISQ